MPDPAKVPEMRMGSTQNPVQLWNAYRIKLYGKTALPKSQESSLKHAFLAGMISCSIRCLSGGPLPETIKDTAGKAFRASLRIRWS